MGFLLPVPTGSCSSFASLVVEVFQEMKCMAERFVIQMRTEHPTHAKRGREGSDSIPRHADAETAVGLPHQQPLSGDPVPVGHSHDPMASDMTMQL